VPENAPARLIEHKAPQTIILLDETTLLPNRVTGRRRYSAHNHIANFTFRVATYYLNDSRCSHFLLLWIRSNNSADST
jgi:hypothetical protein